MNAVIDDPEPVKPEAPEPWQCCQSGCEPCVYDRYWEALTHYERALAAWRARQGLDPQK
jgi:hypothetical protein